MDTPEIVYMNLNTYPVLIRDSKGKSLTIMPGFGVEGGEFEVYSVQGLLTSLNKDYVEASKVVGNTAVAPVEVMHIAPLVIEKPVIYIPASMPEDAEEIAKMEALIEEEESKPASKRGRKKPVVTPAE